MPEPTPTAVTAHVQPGPPAWRPGAAVALTSVVVLGVLFLWPTVTMLALVYRGNPDYSHGFLIPLISVYLVYESRDHWHLGSGPWQWAGGAVFGAGILLVLLGRWYELVFQQRAGLGTEFVCGIGLVIMAGGFVLFLGGWPLLKGMALPVVYLVFAVPLPVFLASRITLPLRALVSTVSAGVLRGLQVQVLREGNILHLASGSLGIADACSGIRSLWTMLALAGAVICISRCRLWKAFALGALAVVMAVFGNLLRVIVTGLLVSAFGMSYASGWRHELCGWAAFAVGAAGLLLVSHRLVHSTGAAPAAAPAPAPATARPSILGSVLDKLGRRPQVVTLTLAALLLAAGTAASAVLERHYTAKLPPPRERQALEQLPDRLGDHVRVVHSDLEEWDFRVLRPTDRLFRTYRDSAGHDIALGIMYWTPSATRLNTGMAGPHLPDDCYPRSGWKLLEPLSHAWALPNEPERELRLRVFAKPSFRQMVLYWHKGLYKWTPWEKRDRLKVLFKSWHAPVQENADQYIVTLSTAAGQDSQAALQSALRLIERLLPLLPEYGIGPAPVPAAMPAPAAAGHRAVP